MTLYEDDGWEAEPVSFGACVASASLKKFQTLQLAMRCLVLLFRRPTSLYRSTVYVDTNMHAVSVCF